MGDTMKNILFNLLVGLSMTALYGCTDKEPEAEPKQQETVFQGQIDALKKAEDVSRIIETHSAQQREAIDEQSQ